MVPLKCVPSPVRQPLGGSFGNPGGRQFCLALSQYQPVGQSAKFTAAGGTSRADKLTLATASPVATDRPILRFFTSSFSFAWIAFPSSDLLSCSKRSATIVGVFGGEQLHATYSPVYRLAAISESAVPPEGQRRRHADIFTRIN